MVEFGPLFRNSAHEKSFGFLIEAAKSCGVSLHLTAKGKECRL
jgi:hypothetical protein